MNLHLKISKNLLSSITPHHEAVKSMLDFVPSFKFLIELFSTDNFPREAERPGQRGRETCRVQIT